MRPTIEWTLPRLLLDLLALPDHGWRRDEVCAVLSAAPVRDKEGNRVPASRWERISRVAGVVGDDPTLETAMARKAGAIGFGVTTGIYKQEDWLAQPPANRPHRLLTCVGDLLKLGVIA